MTHVEITKELFQANVPCDIACDKVEHGEHAVKFHYNIHGVRFTEIQHFTTCTTQYFIQDINA